MNICLSCVAAFSQIPAFTLSVSQLSAHLAVLRCFITATQARFQDPKLYRPGSLQTHTDPLGESCHAVASASLSQKGSSLTSQGLGVYGKAIKELASRLVALSRCLYPYANKWGSIMCPPILLSPKRQCHLSQMYSRRGTVSPSETKGILRTCCLLSGPCPPSPWKHCYTSHSADF